MIIDFVSLLRDLGWALVKSLHRRITLTLPRRGVAGGGSVSFATQAGRGLVGGGGRMEGGVERKITEEVRHQPSKDCG